MFDDLKRDRCGFYKLDSFKKELREEKSNSVYSFLYNGKKYFFKELQNRKSLNLFNYLADNNYEILSEILTGKFYKKFNLEVVDNHLGKIGDKLGVFSEDYAIKHSNVKLLTNDLNVMGIIRSSLSELKQKYKITENATENFVKQIELLPLVYASAGQIDVHSGNIAVYYNKDNQKDGVILFDHEGCYMAQTFFSNLELLQSYSNNPFEIDINMGIEDNLLGLEGLYVDVKKSKNISTYTIRSYLEIMTGLLSNGSFIKEINAEVEEEYHLPIPENYLKRLDTVMTSVYSGIEEYYGYRIKELGE